MKAQHNQLFLIVRQNGAEQYEGSIRDVFFYLRNSVTRYETISSIRVYQIGTRTKCREISQLFWNAVSFVRRSNLESWSKRGLLDQNEITELQHLQGGIK